MSNARGNARRNAGGNQDQDQDQYTGTDHRIRITVPASRQYGWIERVEPRADARTFSTMSDFLNDYAGQSRIVAKLLRNVLRVETFDTLADVVAALKEACSKHHVRWTPDDITEALRVVGSNRELVRVVELPRVTAPPEVEPALVVPPAVAVRVVRELYRRHRASTGTRPRSKGMRVTAKAGDVDAQRHALGVLHRLRPSHIAPLEEQ